MHVLNMLLQQIVIVSIKNKSKTWGSELIFVKFGGLFLHPDRATVVALAETKVHAHIF